MQKIIKRCISALFAVSMLPFPAIGSPTALAASEQTESAAGAAVSEEAVPTAETASTVTETTATTATTAETTVTTTTTTVPAPLPDPVFTAEFEEGYPTGDTVLHLKLLENTGIHAIGLSVCLPEILSADAGEEDVCAFALSDAFDAENLFTYYNSESHVLSVVCAGMDPAATDEELGSITLHIAEEAESGKKYPVTLLLSSLALADGREYALIERTVNFIPAETPLRTLSETDLTVNDIGEPIQLTLSPEPPAGSCKWESSNPEKVSVDENGQILCLQEGYAEITVSCEKRTYTCKVTVRFDRSLNCEEMRAADDGETMQLSLEPAPDTILNWESSAPDVLSIDENGVATAHKNGEVTILVRTEYFEYAFPFRVIIPREISAISHTFSERGETMQLSLTPAPLDPVQWTSDDMEIAAVAEDGTVTPLKNGSTFIRAVCEGKEYTCMVNVNFPYALNFTDYAVRKAGEGVSLTLLPKEDATPAAEWISSDPTIAEVDQDGNVTVLRKGEAVIYCVAGGKTYNCHVMLMPYMLGDVDQNSTVDVADAQLALQYYTDLLTQKPGVLAAQQRLAADINADGVIGLEDVMAILQYSTEVLAHKSPTWEEILSRFVPSE